MLPPFHSFEKLKNEALKKTAFTDFSQKIFFLDFLEYKVFSDYMIFSVLLQTEASLVEVPDRSDLQTIVQTFVRSKLPLIR